ncbi:MAG: hypothetical protein J6M21_00405 [Campylobacter sp.]|nr:hypothetical protein [Campylobacter sp.]
MHNEPFCWFFGFLGFFVSIVIARSCIANSKQNERSDGIAVIWTSRRRSQSPMSK